MATSSPNPVATKASATPPVIANGCPSEIDKMSNDRIMPVTVPKSPIKGAKVTIALT